MRSDRSTGRRKAVLLVTHENSAGDASLRYRSFHHAESLGLLGVSCDVMRHGAPDLPAAIADYECILLHRFPWDAAAPLVRRAGELGKLVVTDTDDLVFEPSVSHDIEAIDGMSDDWRAAWHASFRTTIEACQGAIVPTAPLGEFTQALADPVEVLSNVVDDEMVRLADRAREIEGASRGRDREAEVAISYFSGSLTHGGDFEEAADSVLWALETYPHVRFVAVGRLELDARFDRFSARVSLIPWHPWQTLPELQAQTDVSLAPLAPGMFNECKSCVKYLEASLVGVPTVASARGDFVRVIEHGRNGLLAEGAAGWREALQRLIGDPSLRQELGLRAHADVLANHTTRSRLAAAERAWHSLTRSRTSVEDSLTVDWLLGEGATEETIELVVRLARTLSGRGHAVRICVEPTAITASLAGRDAGEAVIATGPFADLAPADARIATDALTAWILRYQENALFRFRLVRTAGEVGFELPVRHVCVGADVAGRVSERSGRPAAWIEPDSDPGAELDRFLRTVCFLRLEEGTRPTGTRTRRRDGFTSPRSASP
jgi:glycosyltransferase involved in cell wall biosynthesis